MEQQGKKPLAIVALILGIVACVISWWGLIPGILGIVCAIVGLVLAIMAQKSYKAIGQKSGMATAGLVLSIIGLILSIIGLVLSIVGTIVCGIVLAAGSAIANDPETQRQISSALEQISSSVN